MEQAFRTAKRGRHCQKKEKLRKSGNQSFGHLGMSAKELGRSSGARKIKGFAERIIDFISLTSTLFHGVPLQGCPVNQPPRISNAAQGATPHSTNRLATRVCAGSERWRYVDSKPAIRCCGGAYGPQRHNDRWGLWPRRGSTGDGGW